MKPLKTLFLLVLMIPFAWSCSVISQQVRKESLSPLPFKTVLQDAEKYAGETVILGGYILDTKNLPDETVIKVLQVPLGLGDTPKSKELSEGRFILFHKGFLDPEVYSKDRRITIAGKIAGSATENIDNYAQKYLKVESREIYLWSDQEPYYPPPYYYYMPWYYPYPYFRHHPHPYFYWW